MSAAGVAEAPAGRRTAERPVARRRRRGSPVKKAIFAAIAYIIALLFIFPYAVMVIAAARPLDEQRNASYFPTHWDWSNFTTLWSGEVGLGPNIVTSLEIASGATGLVLLVSLPAAYYTARRKFRGRTAFLLLVLVTQMFQPAAMLIGIYREFVAVGIGPVFALILVNAGFGLAFATWIMNAYFTSIPAELEEAAMVDGAGRLGALLRITLPLALPGIATALIFTFIAAWNEFVVALILTSGGTGQPIAVRLDSFIGGYQIDWGHLFAASVVAIVPVIILFGLIERKVVSGLTAGSIK